MQVNLVESKIQPGSHNYYLFAVVAPLQSQLPNLRSSLTTNSSLTNYFDLIINSTLVKDYSLIIDSSLIRDYSLIRDCSLTIHFIEDYSLIKDYSLVMNLVVDIIRDFDYSNYFVNYYSDYSINFSYIKADSIDLANFDFIIITNY